MNKELKDLIILLLNIVSGLVILAFSLIGLIESTKLHNYNNDWFIWSLIILSLSMSIVITTSIIKQK